MQEKEALQAHSREVDAAKAQAEEEVFFVCNALHAIHIHNIKFSVKVSKLQEQLKAVQSGKESDEERKVEEVKEKYKVK